MSQIENGQSRLDQLPYYREYLEHVLKPHVLELVDQVRSSLLEHVWTELVERMAEEQRPGASSDPEAQQQIRSLLQQTLRLQLGAQIVAGFDGALPAEPLPAPDAAPDVITRPIPGAEMRPPVEVVDRGFPNNPLARAVGGIKRAGR
jgi:hypothetical protein